MSYADPNRFPLTIVWPDSVHPDLADLREQDERITARRRELTTALTAAQARERFAPQVDRENIAAAARAGKPAPKVLEVQAVRDLLARLLAENRGLIEASWQIRAEIEAKVEQVRADWDDHLRTVCEIDREEYAAAVEQLIATRTRLAESTASRRWLARFPNKPGRAVQVADVDGLTGENHQGYAFTDVAAALREDAAHAYAPPAPAAPVVLPADDLLSQERDPGVEMVIGR